MSTALIHAVGCSYGDIKTEVTAGWGRNRGVLREAKVQWGKVIFWGDRGL